jgi:hypothetical protein
MRICFSLNRTNRHSTARDHKFTLNLSSNGEPGNSGGFTVSVAGENENEVALSNGLEVPASSPTFQSPRSGENHAQFANDTNGKPSGEVEGYTSSCSPLHNTSLSKPNSEATKVISVTDFFYDDPTMPYVALPDHELDQSPCCSIIAIKDGYYLL